MWGVWEDPSGKEPATFVGLADSNRFVCVCVYVYRSVSVSVGLREGVMTCELQAQRHLLKLSVVSFPLGFSDHSRPHSTIGKQ